MTRLALLTALTLVSLSGQDAGHDFEMQVRPVLAKNCWACHRQSAMGGLRLDSRASILKGGKSGPAIVEGKSQDSLIIQAVTGTHERLKMPPSGKLSESEVAALKTWIDKGAFWPADDKTAAEPAGKEYKITPEQRAFWSFQPVPKPTPDASIDKFITERLNKEGLTPVGRADKRTLIRRASLDLTGLPPTPDEVETFLTDNSPDAFAKVIDRLLASKQYGERWGRYWLDVARYADDKFNSTKEELTPNAWRYRNWVISAFNGDMPYDRFVRAQIAGDTMGEHAGLGYYALSPEMQDDRVDATSRGFLGLTVACATCHDHKFDPIPQKDFYSLQSVFTNTKIDEYPLASKDVVSKWKDEKKKQDDLQKTIDRFYDKQREAVAEVLAAQSARYLLAAAKLQSEDGLDAQTLARMRKYLAKGKWDHPYLKLPVTRESAAEFQRTLIAVNQEKKQVDERNLITLGVDPERNKVANATLVSLERQKFMLWRDMFEKSTKDAAGFFQTDDGVFYYDKKTIEAWLSDSYRQYIAEQKTELAALKKALPEKYPFVNIIEDKDKINDVKVSIRGDRNNLGEVAPRRFLAILSPDERKPFTKGAGREELADAIANPTNPLTARVFVNRVWQHHFGRGLVGTPSNFGQLGERPTHPELLDYLAGKFMQDGWSVKKLHREIMLSDVYQRSCEDNEADAGKDGANTYLWRYNRQRLDVEALRDSILFVSGTLDREPAEEPLRWDNKNRKRTVYSFISRRKVDGTLGLFDFPNPNNTSEARVITNVPLQRLWFMNSEFIESQAKALATRFSGSPKERITSMYRNLFGRDPQDNELKAGLDYTADAQDWASYARALLSSNEFLFLN